MAKRPPVPPENRSAYSHDTHPGPSDSSKGSGKDLKDPSKHGQQANTKQNTTHQGYQQDR